MVVLARVSEVIVYVFASDVEAENLVNIFS